MWDAAHTTPLERAVSAGRELGWRARAEQRAGQAVEPPAVAAEAAAVAVAVAVAVEACGIARQRR